MTGEVIPLRLRAAPARKREHVGAGKVLIFPGMCTAVAIPAATVEPKLPGGTQTAVAHRPQTMWPPTPPYRPGF